MHISQMNYLFIHERLHIPCMYKWTTEPFFIKFYLVFCSNAVKFTHEGKVKINLYIIPDPCSESQQKSEIDMEESESHERVVWIRCDVEDSGIGIPGAF